MKTILTRDMAALALDLSIAIPGAGPRIEEMRMRVATWLDCGGKVTTQLRHDVTRLIHLGNGGR